RPAAAEPGDGVGREGRDMAETPSVTELIVRWLELRDQRPTITVEEVCADCPERIDEVRKRLAALGALEEFLKTRPEGSHPDSSTMAETRPAEAQPGRPAPPPGAAIPGYELLDELGHGGMAVGYRAVQVRLKRTLPLQ